MPPEWSRTQTRSIYLRAPLTTINGMLATLPPEEGSAAGAMAPGAHDVEGFEKAVIRHERKVLASTVVGTLALSALAGAAFCHSIPLLLCSGALAALFASPRMR